MASFERFPDLPVELQTLVWKHALPGPQIAWFEDSFGDGLRCICKHKTGGRPSCYQCTHPYLHALYNACSASRKVVLSVYRRTLEEKVGYHIYMDFKKDWVYMDSDCLGEWSSVLTEIYPSDTPLPVELGDIQNLAVKLDMDSRLLDIVYVCWALHKLDNLTVVTPTSTTSSPSQLTETYFREFWQGFWGKYEDFLRIRDKFMRKKDRFVEQFADWVVPKIKEVSHVEHMRVWGLDGA